MAACPAAFHEFRQRSGHLALRSVNHISKVCSNLEASVAFYRDILGFMLVKRPDTFNETFEGAWLWGYGIGLHLIKGRPVPRSKQIDPKSDHLSFQADSLVDVEAQLQARNIPYVRQQVVEHGLQVDQLFFHDCDDNMIEVCNCDCLPVIPLELPCASNASALNTYNAVDDEEMSSDGSRDSLDSSRSEQMHPSMACALAAVPLVPLSE